MNNDIDIQELQPDYYRGIQDFQEIAKAENSVFNEFNAFIQQQLMNSFISTADDSGITMKEHEYNILGNENKPLEDRKTAIRMRLLPPRPITLNYLSYLLKQLNFVITTKMDYDNSIFYIYVDVNTYTDAQLSRIQDILATYVPCNVVTKIYRYEHGKTTLGNFIGIANTVHVHAHADYKKGE